MNREQAWEIVQGHVEAEGLRRHMQSVEAAMRLYAEKLEEDVETWGLAGLLHDYDWEIHPTLGQHPKEGIPFLRENGCPETVLQAILSHNTAGTGIERSQTIDYALLACDEITGLLIAATLVRPDKNIAELKLKSIKKRWKSKVFAGGVNRDEVAEATEDFSRVCFGSGLELWDHAQNVLEAMQGAAEALDLDGRMAAAVS